MNKDKIPAAMYIRMSTEHQKYSPENQAAAIREYAERNDYEIIKTYTDGGKSGLNIAGRAALQQMLKDVQSHQAEYKAILVLDVTRWGRFQDADESAYYEYICKRAGTPVKYCNEQFDNDGSPVATIVKGVKRTMAAEYSRELSCKVFAGKCRLINLGYRQGGFAGFGLRRMLVNEHGEHKGILVAGEHKSIATDRVILVPGPEEEQKIKGYSSAEIARKTGFTAEYINQISKLLFRGEERLINDLISLKGCPKEVLGDFRCCNNRLKSLDYAPKAIKYNFDCSNNGLKSLQNAPQEVGFDFDCSYNELTSLEGAPVKVGEDMDCRNNSLISLNGAPQEISGDFKCKGNQALKSLTGIGLVKGKIISDIK